MEEKRTICSRGEHAVARLAADTVLSFGAATMRRPWEV